MKETIKINGRYWCPQCGHYYDYKEMADVKTCQECVSRLRELRKVDFKRLLESMPDEDVEEVFEELTVEPEYELREALFNEIHKWSYGETKGTIRNDQYVLADRIIKLIK